MKLKHYTSNGIFDVVKPYTQSNKISRTIDTIRQTKIPTISDAEGLRRAYEQPNKVFVDNNTNKMYIAGTANLHDVWDDLKIPFHLTSHSQRYEQAEQALKENPNIKEVVSHSLGGAVGLELQKHYPNKFKVRTYGSPTLQFGGEQGDRYRHPGDFISIFDKGAINVPAVNWLNPLASHSYEGYGDQGLDDIGDFGSSFSYSKKKAIV